MSNPNPNPNPKKISPFFCGKHYKAMAEDLDVCGLAKWTHAGYLRAVRQLAEASRMIANAGFRPPRTS